jgi:hypothetical protein
MGILDTHFQEFFYEHFPEVFLLLGAGLAGAVGVALGVNRDVVKETLFCGVLHTVDE